MGRRGTVDVELSRLGAVDGQIKVGGGLGLELVGDGVDAFEGLADHGPRCQRRERGERMQRRRAEAVLVLRCCRQGGVGVGRGVGVAKGRKPLRQDV